MPHMHRQRKNKHTFLQQSKHISIYALTHTDRQTHRNTQLYINALTQNSLMLADWQFDRTKNAKKEVDFDRNWQCD